MEGEDNKEGSGKASLEKGGERIGVASLIAGLGEGGELGKRRRGHHLPTKSPLKLWMGLERHLSPQGGTEGP